MVKIVLLNMFRTILIICLGLSVFSCRKAANPSDYDEQFVKDTIKPGMSRQEVLSYFGKPLIESAAQEGATVMVYRKATKSFRTKDMLEDKGGFDGFEVFIRDDKVLEWHPITSGPMRSR
jgi:hypothetical protein